MYRSVDCGERSVNTGQKYPATIKTPLNYTENDGAAARTENLLPFPDRDFEFPVPENISLLRGFEFPVNFEADVAQFPRIIN
ncbi:MAG: hypothetical protein COA73_00670 [Candidatus Hydrogenedentota bacterium]|nr:MAG: hypothetical protein COA73_00670 [Candidatus Hydrogenedentota bacterium]